MNELTKKEILLTGLGIAIGLEIFDYFESGEINLIRFSIKVLLCTFLFFLCIKIKNWLKKDC